LPPPAGNRSDIETETAIVHVAPTLQAGGNLTGGARPPGSTADTAESLIPVVYSVMPMNSGKDYKAREVEVAQPVMASGPVGGDQGGDYVVQPIAFNARQDPISGPVVTDGASNAIAFSLRGREGGAMPEVEDGDVSPALRAAEGGSTRPFIAFDETQITSKGNYSNPQPGDPCHPLAATARPPTLAAEYAVRRITVVEAETLQGFRPNYTLIEWPTANRKGKDLRETISYLIGHGYSPEEAAVLAQTPDGPRYKAIGNSKAVPLVRKIGARFGEELARYLAETAA
jgi:DNA (cytosine-5)-methyltransferase 1